VEDAHRRRLDLELIRHPRNLGAAAARNTGMRASSTEWVSFLDSDDFLLRDSLSTRWRQVAARVEAGQADRIVFGCGWIEFVAPLRPLGVRMPRAGRGPDDFASGCWFSPGSCVFLNQKAATGAAGFQDETLARFEDVDWFFSLALAGFTLEALPMVSVAIERTRTNRPARIEAAAAALLAKWQDQPAPLRRRLESYMDLEISAANYFAGQMPAALASLARSLSRAPRLSLQLSPGWERRGPASVEPGRLEWLCQNDGRAP
jgi:glycosyltransferase involved in cell wall biosynthesis